MVRQSGRQQHISRWLPTVFGLVTGELMRLFVGDDWAEDHHDVEVMNGTGKVLAQ